MNMVVETPISTMERRHRLEEMVAQFDMDTVKAMVRSISDHTGMPCDRIADMMIEAWQRRKSPVAQGIEQDELCFEKIIMYP